MVNSSLVAGRALSNFLGHIMSTVHEQEAALARSGLERVTIVLVLVELGTTKPGATLTQVIVE